MLATWKLEIEDEDHPRMQANSQPAANSALAKY
jgi:hypothetical protein